jgi:hypothetical protein
MVKHETSPRHEVRAPASYLVETANHYGDNAAMVKYLTDRLADGWELVSVVGATFYFKASAN